MEKPLDSNKSSSLLKSSASRPNDFRRRTEQKMTNMVSKNRPIGRKRSSAILEKLIKGIEKNNHGKEKKDIIFRKDNDVDIDINDIDNAAPPSNLNTHPNDLNSPLLKKVVYASVLELDDDDPMHGSCVVLKENLSKKEEKKENYFGERKQEKIRSYFKSAPPKSCEKEQIFVHKRKQDMLSTPLTAPVECSPTRQKVVLEESRVVTAPKKDGFSRLCFSIDDQVTDLESTKDGQYIIAAFARGSVRIYDLKSSVPEDRYVRCFTYCYL